MKMKTTSPTTRIFMNCKISMSLMRMRI